MSEMEYGSDEHLDGLSRNALKTEVRWWHDRANEMEGECERLQADNAKLRDELAKARDPQRIGGQADPSSFVYAIEQLREFRWQHATNDEDAIPYINNVAAAHERENAKLRELVWRLLEIERIGATSSEWHKVHEVARELKIEVDE